MLLIGIFMSEIEKGCNKINEITSNFEKAKNLALEMLEAGICCTVIANRTGLSKAEIQKLNNHECKH